MIEWKANQNPVQYPDATAFMDARVDAIRNDGAKECVWFLEHPPLYTAGMSAKDSDLLNPQFPVFKTGRGGEYTYHGPGQRVAYAMLDLKKRQTTPDIRKYVFDLEEWIIQTLAVFNIKGERRDGRIGIWVVTDTGEKKIAAIGVRIRKWVTLHGIAINVNPDLNHFGGIVPCGINNYGVTSMKDVLDKQIKMSAIDDSLMKSFNNIFEAGN